MRRKRTRWVAGDIVKIDIGGGYYAFARVLENPLVAFYAVKAREVLSIDSIISAPIAFKLWVMNYAITEGEWPVIGHAPLSEDLKVLPAFFKEDPISRQLSITYIGGGDERPVTLSEIRDLECAAVWEPEHVVDRLNDHFFGRPNKWVEAMKPKQMHS